MIPNYEFIVGVAGETAQKTLLSELQGQFYNTTHKNDWFNMEMNCIVQASHRQTAMFGDHILGNCVTVTHSQLTLPSGNLTQLWKITMLLMGKLTISMAIFNSYVSLPEGIRNHRCS